MPADTTETVAEHSARLQPSINLHAPITYSLYVQLLWYPMYNPRRDEGSGKPCAVIKAV